MISRLPKGSARPAITSRVLPRSHSNCRINPLARSSTICSRISHTTAFGFIGIGYLVEFANALSLATRMPVPAASQQEIRRSIRCRKLQHAGSQDMSIKSQSLPFTESLIEIAPDTTGVFALWQNGGVIYIGKASAGSATIRKALSAQFEARR